MSKSITGYMIKDDYDLYEIYFNKDGVTHADIFRDKDKWKDEPLRDFPPLKLIKVKVTIEKLSSGNRRYQPT